jgi:hypothetical protein
VQLGYGVHVKMNVRRHEVMNACNEYSQIGYNSVSQFKKVANVPARAPVLPVQLVSFNVAP